MTVDWKNDEYGNRIFTHEKWTVKIWNNDWNTIDVESEERGVDVSISEEGLWVEGEGPGGWEGPSPKAFTIPWVVLEAIFSAREILAQRIAHNSQTLIDAFAEQAER
jgi:hypothetical protein